MCTVVEMQLLVLTETRFMRFFCYKFQLKTDYSLFKIYRLYAIKM